MGVRIGARPARLREDPDGRAGLPNAWPAGAPARRSRPHGRRARAGRRPRSGRAGRADDQPSRAAGDGRRRLTGAVPREHRRERRWSVPEARAARSAGALGWVRTERLPGQPHRAERRDHVRGGRRGLAPAAGRGADPGVDASAAGGAAAAELRPDARVRRGLVNDAALERRAARRAAASRRRARRRGGHGRVAPARGLLSLGHAGGRAGRRRAGAARPARERCAAVARSRISGAGDRALAAPRPQHQMGRQHDLVDRMSRAVTLWRRVYGAGPLHLAGHLIAFVIARFGLHRIVAAGHAVDFLAWFLAAAVAHDLLLLPLYSLLDRGAARAVRRHRWRLEGSVINHLRAPAFISGVLLLVYAPEILGLGDTTYLNATGHHLHG